MGVGGTGGPKKISLFEKSLWLTFLWLGNCQKSNMATHFWQFTSHKMAKKQNFQNCYVKFVKLHTGKLITKFQDPSIFKLSK